MLKRKLSEDRSIDMRGGAVHSVYGTGASPGGSSGNWLQQAVWAGGIVASACLIITFLVTMSGSTPAQAAASEPQWSVDEVPVATGPGDQLSPSLSGTSVVYGDTAGDPAGIVVLKHVDDPGYEEQLFGPGILAGPAIDGDKVAWQDQDSRVCARTLATGAESCVASATAETLSLSGNVAVTGEAGGGSTISRINFETGRSRKLDDYSLPGMRYDPDIDGNQAVWVRMRGYGSQYYEPLIVSYDVTDDTWSYLTATGGGGTPSGESVYERRRPSVSNGRVLYQQRPNQAGSDWDIYEAVAGTYGLPVVEAPGDQVNPSLDGDLLVWQDNRNGYGDEWDIYIMDLSTGQEQLLVSAPGDQIEPVVRGDLIVWQDNRNGDWDVYAARITPGDSQHPAEPDLTLSRGDVFWESYQAYMARELSVGYGISNIGMGAAETVTLALAVCDPASVDVAGPLPAPVQILGSGQSTFFQLRYAVPEGVNHFRTQLYASCLSAGGETLWYPSAPPV